MKINHEFIGSIFTKYSEWIVSENNYRAQVHSHIFVFTVNRECGSNLTTASGSLRFFIAQFTSF